jgi:hypothetical protein
MKRFSPNVERIFAGVALTLGFLLMASVFAPDFTEARTPRIPTVRAVNPHTGLRSLGTIEGTKHTVMIMATVDGPRYSVYDRAGVKLLAPLLTAEEVETLYPDLPLRTMDFAEGALMMAEPAESFER